jgi:antitoxin (DNA-binding transcriptional repressor) of toxin-antitoxin stability system
MRKVDLQQAQRELLLLVEEAARGEEVITTRGDGAAFRLMPVPAPVLRPIFGSARGQIVMGDDFDDLLADFDPYGP